MGINHYSHGKRDRHDRGGAVEKVIAFILFAGAAVIATAQPYPSKPVRMVTVEAGGSTDFVARLIAQGVSETLGRAFVIDNRGGASGLIAKETVARANPDGYTLLTDSSALWILPLMRRRVLRRVSRFRTGHAG